MYENTIISLLGLLKQNIETSAKVEAYNVLCTVIEKSPKPYASLFEKYLHDIIEIYTISLENFNENIHTCASSVLQICCAILPQGRIPQKDCNFIIKSVLTLFNSQKKIYEESLQLLGALSMNLGVNFYQYLHQISSYVIFSLTQLNSAGILKSGIMAMSDFSRSLGLKILDYRDEIIPPLIKILESSEVCITSKVLCINCLGDIAGAIQENFICYLNRILGYLDTAAGISLTISDDIDVIEHLAELRECILQFYIGLVQGLSDSGKHEMIKERIPKLVTYISIIVSDKYYSTESLHESALGLIGDIIEKYKDPKLINMLEWYIKKFLTCEGDQALLSRWILDLLQDRYIGY